MKRKYLAICLIFLGLFAWVLHKNSQKPTHSTRFAIHEVEQAAAPVLASKPIEKDKEESPSKEAVLPSRKPADNVSATQPLFVDVVPSLPKSKIEAKSAVPVLKAKEISIPASFFQSLQDGQTLKVELPLFDRKRVNAILKIKRSKDDTGLYFLNGTVENFSDSSVSLTATNNLLVGHVIFEKQSLQIQFSGDKNHFLLSVDERRLPKKLDKSVHSEPSGDLAGDVASEMVPANQPIAAGAPGDVPIRVVVMFTAAAQTAAGGDSAVRAEIQNQITNITQNSMNTSQANVEFTIAHMVSTPYVQSADLYLDLRRFTDGDDSFMDSIDNLLKTHNASLALLYTATSSNYCGMAWLNSTSASSYTKNGYAVSARNCNNKFTVAHELGHNFGADHNDASAGTGSLPYARGYINTTSPMFRDLMAYDTTTCLVANCPRVHMYSTPDVQHLSRAIGSSTADNARRIREVAPTLAQFPTMTKIYPGVAFRAANTPVTFYIDRPPGTTAIQWYVWNTTTSAWQSISGATEDSVRVMVPSSGYISYYASITTSTGLIYSSQAAVSPQPSTANFTITSFDSTTLSAAEGLSRTLSVNTSVAASSLNFQWKINGRDVAGATSSSFTFTTNQNQNIVGVVVSNSSGSVHASRNMNITAGTSAPTITNQPDSLTRNPGQTATFTVVATGSPAPTYQWRRNGTNISGETSATYSIASVATSHEGNYSVVVSNSAGSVTSSNAVLSVNAAPVITLQPASLTRNPGQAASFTVVATGDPAPTYQWRRNGINIAGATAATYSIASVATTHEGNYSVVVTNSLGSVTSSNAALNVSAAPVITSQPASLTRNPGQAASFTVVATGDPSPTYQWRRNGINIVGATASIYSIASVAVSHEGNYSVVVTNSLGSVTSINASLNVTSAPVITAQPTSLNRNPGQTASFTVVASGEPSPTYQWRLNAINIAGATAATYSISSVASTHEGNYSVVVTNSAGTVTSSNAALSLNTAPAITTQPVPITRNQGQTAAFTVVATGDPTPTFQWQRNGTIIAGATAANYSITSVANSHEGNYSVVVTNSAGSVTSSAALLTVRIPPTITTQPMGLARVVGQAASFSVVASGEPAPTYQWRRNGIAITGATAATYSIASVLNSHAGTYSVLVTNAAGVVTSDDAELSLNGAPVITAQPQDLALSVSQTAVFSVTASGTPTPTYQWRRNGTAIAGATAATYTLTNVQASNAGDYTVVVTNSVGSITSGIAQLTINSVPIITAQPVSISLMAGQAAVFFVTATGSPTPTYQWRRNGLNVVGATLSTITVSNVQTAQTGNYSVVVTNTAGSVTSAVATLSITTGSSVPFFTLQPLSIKKNLGETASFAALANGSPAPTYQWYFTPYGQTVSQVLPAQNQTTLTLNNINLSSRGSYVLRATNTAGSVNSLAALLDFIPIDRGQTVIPYLATGPIYLERTGGF